jgi:hypothetical protein
VPYGPKENEMIGRALVALACAAALAGGTALPAQAAAKPAKVRIYKVYYDSPGTDRGSNHSLNAEWVALKNYGGRSANLYLYSVHDRSNHIYRFPHVWLKPGHRIYVHTGSGTNNGTHVYQHRAWYVWNNTSDGVTLRTRYGTKTDTCSWSHRGRGYRYC